MLSLRREYYTTKDVAQEVGISKLTLYRWFKSGKIPEVSKDYKHHRMFSKKDINTIKRFKTRIQLPKSARKSAQGKWSSQFLALAGSWQDNRTPEEIIKDIYAARREMEERDVHF